MRVNLISNNRNQTGLAQDVDILQGMWTLVHPEDTFNRVHHSHPECPEAEVNVFFEVLNPSLFTYAAKNIWIPNPEWTYKTWDPHFGEVDIWCKTDHAMNIFKDYSPTYIGWTSIAKGISARKNYHKALVVVGKNVFRHPQIVVDAYRMVEDTARLPELHIVYDGSRMSVNLPLDLHDKIKLYPSTLKQKEYDDILEECGAAICVSAAEGFGHAVNEAASTGSILIVSEIDPFVEFGYEAVMIPTGDELPSDRVDKLYRTKVADVMVALDQYISIPFKQKKKMSERNASAYIERHKMWFSRMRNVLDFTVEPFSVDETSIPEEDLPGVTIVTPTKDRPYFMEMCAGSVDSQCYPKDKLEWIVLDDGKDTCEQKIVHIPFARHILMTAGKTIAEKRNIGAQIAKFPVIVHFDDDDIYPPNSILFRVSMLMRQNKGAVFCTVLPSYDIANYISFVNVPPLHLWQSERVSEATLAYTKQFWEENGFDNGTQIAEGNTFIRGREHACREISPQEVIVSLVHPRTTSSRRAPAGTEANGCHFGFTDDLFKMLTTIGEHLSDGGGGAHHPDRPKEAPTDRPDGATGAHHPDRPDDATGAHHPDPPTAEASPETPEAKTNPDHRDGTACDDGRP